MKAKKILALLLALSLIIGAMLSLGACGAPDNTDDTDGTKGDGEQNGENNTEAGVDYTVTVVDVNGAPVEGIKLKMTYDGTETATLTTDANGKAGAKIDTLDDVLVEFVDLVGYGSPQKKDRKIVWGETEVTVTLLQMYTVRVVDESGAALPDVVLQICHTSCLEGVSDENGEFEKYFNTDVQVKVLIREVPSGYAIPKAIGTSDSGDVHAYFADGEYTVTVVIPNA